MRCSFPLTELPGFSAFLRAYSTAPGQGGDSADYSALARWFHFNPHDPACYSRRLAQLDALDPALSERRPQVSAALLAQQQAWGADAAAQSGAQALADPAVFAVVTGQQTGLFGGPLYTQLKALSAVKLARRLESEFPGRRFVPMFWLASGDNDFEEVRRSWLIDRGGNLAELALPPEDPALSWQVIGARDCGPDIAAALAQLTELLPGGEHREEVLAACAEDYGPAVSNGAGSLVRGFARSLARFTRGSGLVIVDPQDPALMRSAASLIASELESAGASEAALHKRNAELQAAGHALQVEQLPGDTSLFLLDSAGCRHKLSRDGADFVLRQTGERYARAALLALANSEPERFVCGVMLRPLYQNILIPPVAFIGGGAELAYRAQTTALFDHHAPACGGLGMAPALHRASATLLPDKSAALLEELGWELPQLFVPPQDLAARAAHTQRPEEIEAGLREYANVLNSADARLKALAVQLDPGLGDSFTTLHANLERHLATLEKKITSVLKQRNEALQRRVSLVSAQAYPRLTPQERVLSALSFLPRYGYGLAEALLEQIEVPGWQHSLIVL